MQFTSIIFDLDGTLIDSRADLANAVNFALESAGRERKDNSEIISHVGNGLHDLLVDVLGSHNPTLIEQATKSFEEFYGEHCVDETVLYDDVSSFLRQIKDHLRLGIVTNKPKVFADKILKGLKIDRYFDVVIGGECFDQRKPHPQPIFEALKKLGSPSSSTLMVGDGAQDIQAGRSAEVQTCLAQYGYGYLPSTLKLNPQFCIEKFMDLKEIVG